MINQTSSCKFAVGKNWRLQLRLVFAVILDIQNIHSSLRRKQKFYLYSFYSCIQKFSYQKTWILVPKSCFFFLKS